MQTPAARRRTAGTTRKPSDVSAVGKKNKKKVFLTSCLIFIHLGVLRLNQPLKKKNATIPYIFCGGGIRTAKMYYNKKQARRFIKREKRNGKVKFG